MPSTRAWAPRRRCSRGGHGRGAVRRRPPRRHVAGRCLLAGRDRRDRRLRVERGDLLAIGEQEAFAAVENGHLNGLLSGLGSPLSVGTSSLDAGFNDTIPAQIIAQPGLTDGVVVVNHGNVNSISGTPAAAGFDGPFLLAKNLTSVWGAAEEIAGGGEVVLCADANLLSHIEDEVGNDNHVLFLNVAPPLAFAVPALGPGTGLWVVVALMTTAAVWRLAGRTVEHAVGSRRG